MREYILIPGEVPVVSNTIYKAEDIPQQALFMIYAVLDVINSNNGCTNTKIVCDSKLNDCGLVYITQLITVRSHGITPYHLIYDNNNNMVLVRRQSIYGGHTHKLEIANINFKSRLTNVLYDLFKLKPTNKSSKKYRKESRKKAIASELRKREK